MIKKWFYDLLHRYLSFYIRPDNTVWEINSPTHVLIEKFPEGKPVRIHEGDNTVTDTPPDYILLNGNLHYENDIEVFLETVHSYTNASTRVIIVFYSSFWKPLIQLSSFLGIRNKTPELNWIAPEDVNNFLRLTDFELVRHDKKILFPLPIPFISYILNRFIAPLPLFQWFTLVNIVVAKPITHPSKMVSVSVVVPARNEAGNIEEIIRRLPKMGLHDELIFVEGNSTDNTWQVIQEVCLKYESERTIRMVQQPGKGKADAVRKGFEIASQDLLMILDADMTVPPEELPKFYKAYVEGKGEFINGSRLVYPMEQRAMRFFNILGNKFFAFGFSFVLGQRFKDTLCGTKVISRENYRKLVRYRAYFGDFDPFGDFDLIFGASRLTLKIVEVPIHYKERTYGETNIQRWKHGTILLRMLLFAARKIKFL